MIKIAVCDDEKSFVNILHQNLKSIFDDLSLEIEIDDFCDPVPLLNSFSEILYDVVFLDIDMPLSGFDVAAKLRELSSHTQIIFVTSKHNLVYDSFDYRPFYFICKRTPEDLYSDLTHVAKKLAAFFAQHKTLEINDIVLGSVTIPINEIYYIKSEKHYLFYYSSSSSDPIKERRTLSSLSDALQSCGFIKPHRQYLVNMYHISCVDAFINTITMRNGDNIPIGRSLKSQALEQYRLFKRQ
ncbi:MAG: LytTR family DNA-binding domain-containing protein [Clostridia bacterium]|nr:LytTR family DNA-binding domain-containing protein [Clostridia bacterium]